MDNIKEKPQGADPFPFPLSEATPGKNHLNEEITTIHSNSSQLPMANIKEKLQGADPPPLPLNVATVGKNHLNEEITTIHSS
jgi:hypothetical protein